MVNGVSKIDRQATRKAAVARAGPTIASVTDDVPADDASTLARIVEAARTCFLRDGVRRTRMSDVALEAGVVRQTLYDWVRSRDHLVDLAMAQRARELGEVVRGRPVPADLALEDQVVEVLVAMVELSGGDPEFTLLAQAMPEEHAFAFMAGESELTEALGGVLAPYFESGRELGILRDALGVRAMTLWTQAVLASLRPRREQPIATTAAELRHFLVPALFDRPA